MNLFIKNNYLNIIIAFCALILFCVVLSFDRKVAIDGDARDYYSYLVSIFINHNFTHQSGNDWFLLQTPTGTINVHTIGVSLLMAPFFFVALLFSKLFGYEMDGFSLPFQWGVFIAGIFYCTLGLFFIKKLLLQLHIKQSYVALLIMLLCFGTHLFSYTVNEPGMAHVYAFALTCMFFYFVLNLFQKRTKKYFYLSAFMLALIILVRPVNIILLIFIPFFFQNRYDMLSALKVLLRSKHFYLAFIVLLLVCSIQSIAWYNQNGKLLQDSYAGNGFYFNNPQIFKMLFGFNNGLFIYVPLCLLFLLGIIPIFLANKFKGIVFLVSICFIFYLFASYWAYNYFDGFGIRPMVDFLPVFIIGGAYMFQNFKSKLKYITTGFAFFFLFMNLFYIYQYRSGIIKGNGMNFEKFSYVFLKSNNAYADSLGGSNDLPLYSKKASELVFENTIYKNELDLAGHDTIMLFNYSIKKENSNGFYTLVEFERKEVTQNSSFTSRMMFKAYDEFGNNKSEQVFHLNEIPAKNCCEWKKYSYSIASPGKFNKEDKLCLVINNPNRNSFFIKNFNIKIFDYSYNI